jgi:hypothetical protein
LEKRSYFADTPDLKLLKNKIEKMEDYNGTKRTGKYG